jgi:hypothetical protein
MNCQQEWILMFLLGRERGGCQTRIKDLLAVSSSVTRHDVLRVVELGFVTIEQENLIPLCENNMQPGTITTLTVKGREYFEKII